MVPPELHAVGQRQLAHLGKQRGADLMLLQQVAKLSSVVASEHALAPRVDAAKSRKAAMS
jgi:hypothetical protein